MRVAHMVALVSVLAACDFDDAGSGGGDGAGSDAGAAQDGSAGGDGGGGGETDGGGGGVCGQDPAPTGADSPCPDPCDTCESGVCTVNCSKSSCKNTVMCPDGYECVVLCNSEDACDTSGVQCPADHACSVVCSGGHDACGDFDLTCGSGSCSIECAADTCDGAVVHCGGGACTGTCEGTSPAAVDCGDSCDCTGC